MTSKVKLFVLFISLSILGCQNSKRNYLCEKAVGHLMEVNQKELNIQYDCESHAYLMRACEKYPLSEAEHDCVMLATSYYEVSHCVASKKLR